MITLFLFYFNKNVPEEDLIILFFMEFIFWFIFLFKTFSIYMLIIIIVYSIIINNN